MTCRRSRSTATAGTVAKDHSIKRLKIGDEVFFGSQRKGKVLAVPGNGVALVQMKSIPGLCVCLENLSKVVWFYF